MIKSTRRQFLKLVGAAGAASPLALSSCATTAPSVPNVVVVGGGFGGATAARYVKKFDPSINVTLLEPNKTYVTCPFSNAYLGGLRSIGSITHNYSGLSKAGVNVVHAMATGVDVVNKLVWTADGSFPFDRAIMSPGIDFKWDATPGYDEAASKIVPHAWKAGAQTEMLRQQLMAMEDGGLVIIAPPPNPFRCPPGPYERASMIAYYLKTVKPKSKLLILDPKAKFSKMPLFQEGWAIHYKDYIEWVGGDDGKVVEVDAKTRTVKTDFQTHKADVLNFIPAQKAGKIAHVGGLTGDGDWCPVNLSTFESTINEGIHVLGDAATVSGMPKSGNAANSEAKACAAAVVTLLKGGAPGTAMTSNTCYSLITPDHGISVTAVWESGADKYKKLSGGLSPKGRDAEFRKQESLYARGWYDNITNDIWG